MRWKQLLMTRAWYARSWMGLFRSARVFATLVGLEVCAWAREGRTGEATHEHANQATSGLAPRPSPWTALGRSPFVVASGGMVLVDDRFSGLPVGGGGGHFFGRLRAAADIHYLLKSSDMTLYANLIGRRGQLLSPLPTWLFSASLGYAFQPGRILLLSPSVRYMNTELAAHGHALVAVIPLEWVWPWGLRLSIDAGLGYAFGGQVRVAQCQTTESCDEVVTQKRRGGVVQQIRFGAGLGF